MSERKQVAKPNDIYQCCLKLLDGVEICRMASTLVAEITISAAKDMSSPKKSRAAVTSLKKVAEALAGVIEEMIDKCVSIVSPTQTDVRWTHATLLAEKKRKATQEELRIQSMKKTRTSSILKSLDNVLFDLVGMEKKTLSPKETKKSAQLADQLHIPVPKDKVLLTVPEAMEALKKCPKGNLREWHKVWYEKNMFPLATVSSQRSTEDT
jgi:hypothetical protein